MYQIIGTPRSRAMRVYWMMEELNLDYEVLPYRPASPEARTFNPSGKIPALLADGAVITDSVAIIQFLADRHGALTFAAGTVARGQQDSFTQFACDEVDGPLWTAAKHSFALPEDIRVPAIKAVAKFEFGRAMQVLETRLGDHEFVMGDTMTVPDLLLGHCAGWAEAAKFDLPAGKLGAYFARIRARPALRRALQKVQSST